MSLLCKPFQEIVNVVDNDDVDVVKIKFNIHIFYFIILLEEISRKIFQLVKPYNNNIIINYIIYIILRGFCFV